MRIIRILLYTLFWVAVAGFAQSQHPSLDPDVAARQAKRTSPEFSLKIQPVHDRIESGEKLLVEVTIDNTLQEEIAMTSFHELGVRELIVLDNQGKPSLTKLGQDVKEGKEFLVGSHSKLFFVQPGKPENEIITVRSDLYDLTKPGTYTVQLQRLDHVTKTWVKSNVVTVTCVSHR